LKTISGTAADVPVAAEVNFVKIRVYSYFDGNDQYLQNATGTWISAEEQWILCGGKTAWSVNLDTNSWTDNYITTITARATDIRGNENDSSFVWFKYDSSAPVTVIQAPDGVHNYNDSGYPLNMIYGTVSDAPQPYENIKKVFVKIYNAVEDYWNGTDWQALEPDPPLEATINPSSWTYTNIPVWTNAYTYDVWSYSVDIATNSEDEGSFHRFKFDKANPDSMVTSISGNSYWNSPPDPISGTSQDSETGIEQVSIRLKYLDGGASYYWNSVDWATDEKWLKTDNQTDPWTDNTDVPSSNKYKAGRIYYIVSRAADTRDRTGGETPPASCLNYETYSANWRKYTWDIVVPTAAIVYPADDGYVSQTGDITGTCYDMTGATYTIPGEIVIDGVVNAVEVKLWKLIGSDTYYWDNVTLSSWTTSVTWSTTTLSVGASSWVLSHPEWESINYWACTRAYDKAGKVQTIFTTTTFQGDFVNPQSWFIKPAAAIPTYYTNEIDEIYGTCSDTPPGEVNNVEICIKNIQSADPNYESFWGFCGSSYSWRSEFWIDAGSPSGENWSWDSSAVNWSATVAGVLHRCWTRAIDKAGNKETEHYNDFNIKAQLPETKVEVPGSNSYRDDLLQITGTADDNSTSVTVAVSSGPGFGAWWNELTDSWVYTEYWSTTSWSGLPAEDWSLNITTTAIGWLDGVQYKVQSKGSGPAGEEDVTHIEDVFFYIDRTKPDSEPTIPAAGSFFPAVSQIRGTSWDTAPGQVGEVKIYIKKTITSVDWYWDGDEWQTGSLIPLAADPEGGSWDSTAKEWYYDISKPTSCWADERIHYVGSMAKDKVPLTEDGWCEISFVIDRTSPTASITLPATNYHNAASLPKIKGTLNDTAPGEVQRIKMSVRNIQTGDYWKEAHNWDTGEEWPNSDTDNYFELSQDSWTYSNISWSNNYDYEVKTYAVDKTTNAQVVISSFTFLYDNEAPNSKLENPSSGDRLSSLSSISGTCKDTTDTGGEKVSNIKEVKVAYKGLTEPNTGYYTGGTDWSAEAAQWFNTVVSTPDWSRSSPWAGVQDDGDYVVYCRAQDYALNYETLITSVTFTWDTTEPEFLSVSPLTDVPIKPDAGGNAEVSFKLSEKLSFGTVKFTGTSGTDNGNIHISTLTYVQRNSTNTQTIDVAGLVDDNIYTLTLYAEDNSDPVKTKTQEYTGIKFDDTEPDSLIEVPSNSGNYRYDTAPGSIEGTSQDGFSLMKETLLLIQDVTSGSTYWNNSLWVEGGVWVSVTPDASPDWHYTIDYATSVWTNGHQYKVTARAEDNAGNLDATLTGTGAEITFKYDTVLPASFVSTTYGGYAKNLGAISGTASDNFVGVDSTTIRIKNNTADLWWGGSDWDGTSASWFPTNGSPTSWNYDASGVTLISGDTYWIQVRSRDYSENEETSIEDESRVVVLADTGTPVATVTYPDSSNLNDTNWLNSGEKIRGTHTDDLSGVQIVEIALNNTSQDKHWEGGPAWADGADVVWLSITDLWSSSWTYSGVNWTPSGADFRIVSRAKDFAENWQAEYSTRSFRYDSDEPVSETTFPSTTDYLNTEPTWIKGTAEDEPLVNSGIDYVKLCLKNVTPNDADYNKYWTGVGWDSAVQWLTGEVDGAWPNWKRDIAAGAYVNGRKYEFSSKAWDLAENVEVLTATNTLVYDTDPPGSFLGKPSQEFESDVTLAKIWGTAVDYPSSTTWFNADVSTVQVRISSGTGTGIYWNGSSWESMAAGDAWRDSDWWAAGSSWTYTSGIPGCFSDGMDYLVNSRGIDRTTSDGSSNPNVETVITTYTFTYDITDPVSVLSMPAADTGGTDPQMYNNMDTVSGTASDTEPGQVLRAEVKIKGLTNPILNKFYDWSTDTWEDTSSQEWSDAITVTGGNWSIDTTAGAFYVDWEKAATPGIKYTLWVRAVDKAENNETESDDNKNDFFFEVPYPETQITYPAGTDADPNYYQEITQSQGTANDYTDADSVWVRISSGPSYGTFWDNDTETWTVTAWNLISTNPTTGQGPYNWNVSISTKAWTDGVKYRIRSKGQGPAGVEVYDGKDGKFFVIDKTNPDSEITGTTNDSHFRSTGALSLQQITGTSWDTSPGKIDMVKVRIEEKASGLYYSGSSWGSEAWIEGTATDGGFDGISEGWKWVVTYQTECWKNEGVYYIRSKAEDKAGNTKIAPQISITIDNTPPDSWMIAPTTYTVYYNSLSEISGTGNDTGDGLWDEILLQIKNTDTTRYWKKDSGWNVAEQWLDSTDTQTTKGYMSISTSAKTWSYTFPDSDWDSGYEYLLTIWGKDKAGNLELSSHTAVIIYDNEKPAADGTQPSGGGSYNSLAAINGTAVDATANLRVSGVKDVDVAYRGLGPTNTNYWNQSNWMNPEPDWFDTDYANNIWEDTSYNPFAASPADGNYQVIIRAYDEAGNYDTIYTTVTFTWDLSKPTFTIVSPSTAATINSPNVTLILGEKMKEGTAVVVYEAETSKNGEIAGSTPTYHILTAGECVDLSTQTFTTFDSGGRSNLIDGNKYKLKIVGKDLADNEDDGSWFRSNIIYDTSEPAADFTYPYKYDHSTMTLISGTASDDETYEFSDVDYNEIKLVREPLSPSYWDGLKWQGSPEWLGCNGSSTWTYSVAISTAFVHGIEYRTYVRATDKAGNPQTSEVFKTFKIDTGVPQGVISDPVGGNYYKDLTNISGTADDDLSGFVGTPGIKIYIKWDGSPIKYWNGSPPWVEAADPIYLEVSSYDGSNWAYNSGPGNANITSGETYKIRAKLTDKAGNENLSAEITCYGDVSDPTAGVYNITDGGFYNASTLSDIDGTASDGSGAGLEKIEIVVREENSYWNDVSKQWVEGVANIKWIVAYSTTTTDYEVWHVTGVNWVDGIDHFIWVKAYDEAGNLTKYGNFVDEDDIHNNPDANKHCKFMYDKTKPASQVDIYPDNETYYSVKYGTFAGHADDYSPGSDVSYVKVNIWREKAVGADAGKVWWKGTYWGDSSMDLSTTYDFVDDDWSYGIPENKRDIFYDNVNYPEQKYIIYSIAQDYAGNFEDITGKCTFYYDVVEPTTSVKLPQNAAPAEYYTSGDVINGMVWGEYVLTDYSRINYVQVKISSGSYRWTGSSWTATDQWSNSNAVIYLSSWTYDTSGIAWGDAAVYTVNSRAVDTAGNVETGFPANEFTYDISKPTSVITSPVGGSVIELKYSEALTISGTAADALSGIKSAAEGVDVRIKQDFGSRYWDEANSTWTLTVTWNPATYTDPAWTLTLSTGIFENDKQYTIWSRARDKMDLEQDVPAVAPVKFKHILKATELVITVPGASTAGDLFSITVDAKNEDGGNALWYQGTVSFDSDDGAAVLPGDYTFITNDGGNYTWSVTTGAILKTAGVKYVKVDDGALPTDQENVTVSPAALSSITVSGIPPSVTAGAAQEFTVVLKDEFGNQKDNFTGWLLYSAETGSDALLDPTSSYFDNDYSTTVSPGVTFQKTGDWWVKAIDTVTAVSGYHSDVSVGPAAISSFSVSGLPSSYEAGLSTSITIIARDQFGNVKTDFAGEITFTSDDDHAQTGLPAPYTFVPAADNGLHEFEADYSTTTVKLCTVGSRYVQVDDGFGHTGKQTVNVTPATRDHYGVTMSTDIIAGNYYDITVVAYDVFGNTDTACIDAVKFLTNNPDYDLPTTDTLIGGEKTWSGTEGVALMKSSWTAATGDLTAPWYVEAQEDDPTPIATGTVSNIKVNPRPATQFIVWGIDNPIIAGVEDSFYVRAEDENNNRDVNYVSTITFESDNGIKDTDWYVSPSTYVFTATDKGKKLFPTVALKKASPPNYYIRAWQSIPSSPTLKGEQENITVNIANLKEFSLTGIANPQRIGHISYGVEVMALDDYGNVFTTYDSTVSFSCATDGSMAVSPDPAGPEKFTDGIATFTVTMNTAGSEHDVKVYDINTGEEGWQNDVAVTTKPVSAVTKPTNTVHCKSPLANLVGTAYAYSPAEINKVEIKLQCVFGGSPATDNDFWQGGDSWLSGEKWLLAEGTTDWSRGKPETWPIKSGEGESRAAKFNLWVKSYDDLGSTETVTSSIEFFYDEGEPKTGVYQPNSDYVNSKPVLKGTAVDPPGLSGNTNANITGVEIAIKHIDAGTTNYWDHDATSWKSTTTVLWFAAGANDGSFNQKEDDWVWDTDEVAYQNQEEYFVYSRAYEAAGNMEATPAVKRIVYDEDSGVSYSTIPAGGGQNYSSMEYIEGISSDTQGVDYVDIAVQITGSNYFSPATWDFTSGTTVWIRTSGTDSWSWYASTVPWNDGANYTVKSKVTDKAGNPEIPGAGASFIFDTSSPTSGVDYPVGAYDYINDSTDTLTIVGTSNDAHSNVNKVEIAIRRGGSDFWTGSGWASPWNPAYWHSAQMHPSSWTYTGIECGNGYDHYIWVRPADDAMPLANQREIDPTSDTQDSRFKYDVSEPQSDTYYPGKDLAYNIKITTFIGTYIDYLDPGGSGVSNVKVKIYRNSGTENHYWQGQSPYWGDSDPALATTLVPPTTFEFYIDDPVDPLDVDNFYVNSEEKYFIYVQAADNAGNYEDGGSWAVSKSTFYYDTVPPDIGISTPAHLDHYNALTEIGGTSYDAFSGLDFIEVRISTGQSYFWTGSTWTNGSFWITDGITGLDNWSYTSLQRQLLRLTFHCPLQQFPFPTRIQNHPGKAAQCRTLPVPPRTRFPGRWILFI